MKQTPPDPPPPRVNVVDVLLLTICAVCLFVLVANLVDFGRLVYGWGGHC